MHKQQDGSNLKLDIDFFSFPSVEFYTVSTMNPGRLGKQLIWLRPRSMR